LEVHQELELWAKETTVDMAQSTAVVVAEVLALLDSKETRAEHALTVVVMVEMAQPHLYLAHL
jgi:hypothetical protein